jgi:uncharacterized protein YciI
MEKKYFAIKLIPSRPTFAMDMTPGERAIMQEHVVYWRDWMAKGKIVVFGPIMDPKGPYGFGILQVDDEEEIKSFIAGDPSNTINIFEYYPMRAVVKE